MTYTVPRLLKESTTVERWWSVANVLSKSSFVQVDCQSVLPPYINTSTPRRGQSRPLTLISPLGMSSPSIVSPSSNDLARVYVANHQHGSAGARMELQNDYVFVESILSESEQKARKPGSDYCILSHEAPEEMLPHIYKDGLKSLAQLASESDSPPQHLEEYFRRLTPLYPRSRAFQKDSQVISFHPTLYTDNEPSPHSRKIRSNSILIAVPIDKVRVYNSDLRKSSGAGKYDSDVQEWLRSGKPMTEFITRMSNLEEGQQLNQWGGRPAKPGEATYCPEVLVASRLINPSCFVEHSSIPAAMKEVPGTGAEGS